jgi:hypothetical protein
MKERKETLPPFCYFSLSEFEESVWLAWLGMFADKTVELGFPAYPPVCYRVLFPLLQ